VALGPDVLKQIHERIVRIARDKGVTSGRRMRVDTTVVETDIHHPTDSTLLGDGVRVLTRIMRKITTIAGAVGTKLRDRSRSVKFRLLEIGRVARAKGAIDQDKLQRRYGQLLETTSRVVGQAKRFSEEIAQGVKRATTALKQLALEGLRQELDEMRSLVRQVMKQTRARVFRGNTRSEGKLLSLFEPSTEVIRKGKAGKPNEFGKMVKLQEAENQIITDYEVPSAVRFGPAGRCHRDASGTAGTHAALGGGGRRILLRQERGRREGKRCQARLHSQSLDQKPRPQA
jgi:IS5 family transposase